MSTTQNITHTSHLERLRHRHIQRAGKFFQMFAGASSSLEKYESGILHLEIRSAKQGDILQRIVRNIAKSWRHEPELVGALGFNATVYRKANPPGFVAGLADLEKPDFAKAMVAALKAAADPSSDVLIGIMEGVFGEPEPTDTDPHTS